MEQKQGQNQVPNQPKPKARYIIRVANTDIDGNKPIHHALTKIKGIGKMFANAICVVAEVDPFQKAGELSDNEVAKINDIVRNPSKNNVPGWLFNRKRDPATDKDEHILTSDLDFIKANDLKQLQKIKCYRGIRHYLKLPVRGQRTRSNFRKNKGKVAGVSKKAQQQQKKAKK